MKPEDIAAPWLNSPFLEKFQEIGRKLSDDIKVLERLEKIKSEIKEQRVKK